MVTPAWCSCAGVCCGAYLGYLANLMNGPIGGSMNSVFSVLDGGWWKLAGAKLLVDIRRAYGSRTYVRRAYPGSEEGSEGIMNAS